MRFIVLDADSKQIAEKEESDAENLSCIKRELSIKKGEPERVKAIICCPDGKERVLQCDIIQPPEKNLKKHLSSKFDLEKFCHERILKQYGWRPGKNSRSGPFRVEWVEEAMNIFGVIDRWEQKLKTDKRTDQDSLKLKEAFEYFGKQKGENALPYKLAGGEMRYRLEEGL